VSSGGGRSWRFGASAISIFVMFWAAAGAETGKPRRKGAGSGQRWPWSCLASTKNVRRFRFGARRACPITSASGHRHARGAGHPAALETAHSNCRKGSVG
jgi:hypothetical protein